MPAIYLPLGVAKYQICSVPECGRDAKAEHYATSKGGTKYALGVCELSSHEDHIKSVCRGLENSTIAHTEVDKKTIFRVHAGASQKCKLSGSSKQPPAPAQQRKKGSSRRVATASDSWVWVPNFNKWMSVTGRTVFISKIQTSELVAAAIAVRNANFKTQTKSVSWVCQLVKGKPYFLPEESLAVGCTMALGKLEEFREELEERGVLG